MTIIVNATLKEERIIKNRLNQSGLAKHIDKIVVINDFVDVYSSMVINDFVKTLNDKQYQKLNLSDNPDEKTCGMCIFLYKTYKIQKTEIIISSMDFISKNPNTIHDFDTILCHELGHVHNRQRHEYEKFLWKILWEFLPESKELRFISSEIYADNFCDTLKSNCEINKKKILRIAKQNLRILADEVYKIKKKGSGGILYEPNKITTDYEEKIIKNCFKIS